MIAARLWGLRGVAFLLATLVSGQALAQLEFTGRADLGFDRPEAWAMKYFASLSLAGGFGPPLGLEPGAIDVGFELGSVPSLSVEERTVGFNGTKEEDINRTSIFGRPRVAVGLPAGLTLEGSYLPPIDISGVEPDLLAVAIGRPFELRRGWRGGLRLAVQHGTLAGDFTCSARETSEGPNTFGCLRPSDDEMTIDTASLEFSVARVGGTNRRVEPYASVAVNVMDLDFQVRAETELFVDRTTLLASGTTYSLALGVARGNERGWRWAGEIFYSPLDVVRPPATSSENDAFLNARALLTYRAR